MSRRKQTAVAAAGQPMPSPIQPPEKQTVPASTVTTVASVSAYSGPLPPPALLKEFDEVAPGTAKLIVEQFIKQGEHRMELERAKVRADIGHAQQGLWAAFGISLCAFSVSAWAIACNLPWVAGTVVSMNLVALVTAFLSGKFINKAEREKRLDRTPTPTQPSESRAEPRR